MVILELQLHMHLLLNCNSLPLQTGWLDCTIHLKNRLALEILINRIFIKSGNFNPKYYLIHLGIES